MVLEFKLESNLQQLASIRVAANIWRSRPMIDKMSNFFSNNNISYETHCVATFEVEMKKWFIDTFKQVDSMNLPHAIKNDLLYVMRPVGENLLDYLVRTSTKWSGFFRHNIPGLDVYCKHIEFDCFGRVDEVKTFLNIYNASENFNVIFLFYEACTLCLEDVIHSTWNKCSEHEKSNFQLSFSTPRGLHYGNIHTIQQYWMQFVVKNQSSLSTEATEIDALKYCVKNANNVGFKYFINKLSQDDKNKIILPLAQEQLKHGIEYLLVLTPKRKLLHQCCNLFFMLAHMTEDNKNHLFTLYKQRIISLMIKEWPWKYLLLDLDYFDQETFDWLIKIIVKRIVDDYDFYKKIVYTDLWMISEIWKKNPNRFKESIAEICWSWDKPMMFKLEAVTLVTSVIDDTDGVNKLRPEICQGFEKHCNEFIDKQKYEIVDLYVKNILQNDGERKPYEELLQSQNIN